MPVSTNPSGQAPAQGPGLEDPHNWLGPPPPGQPTGTYDAFQHPVDGVIASTLPREHANTNGPAMTAGTLYVMQFGAVAGTVITNATVCTATSAKTGGTHGWYVITDKTLTVLGVTADQTDASTVWGAANTYYPLPFTSKFICPYTGPYYFGMMVAETAGGTPTLASAPQVITGVSDGTGLSGSPYIFSASSGTSLTTPPAVGDAIHSLTAVRSWLPYAFFT